MFAGAALAGPVGLVVGGLAPKAFKDDVVQFVIRFHNGDVAHFAGSKGDYKRALNSSYKGARPTPPAAVHRDAEPAASPSPVTPTAPSGESEAAELERLRAEVAALRAGQEPAPVSSAPAPPAPPPLPPRRTIEEVRAEMAAERDSRAAEQAEALDGHSRIWFAGVAERNYVTARRDESEVERRQREAQNEQFRKEYKAALSLVRKQLEKDIQGAKMPFKERLRQLNEISREFTYRTKR